MAAIHKITELYVDSFDLIAIHSNMESYAVVYHINQTTGLQLTRAKKDLEVGERTFPMYEWKDDLNDTEWSLVKNTITVEEEDFEGGLFLTEKTLKMRYLIEDRKEINYVLKIDPENSAGIEQTIETLRTIPKISMAYQLDMDSIKSKGNLIF